MSEHYRRLCRSIVVTVGVLGACLGPGASSSSAGPKAVPHCITPTGVDLNERYGVSEGIVAFFCTTLNSGRHWTVSNAWFMSPTFVAVPDGFEPAGTTPLEDFIAKSRKLDERVWANRQTWVIAAGNDGPGAGTVRTPGVAKNALTVGNVLDNGYLNVGDIANDSSRGPTGDGRMKPNLSAPGNLVQSAWAGTTNRHTPLAGTSMATAHVTGLVATLMEHYPEFQGNPALLRAHMMASAIAHDDVTGMSDDYGIGRVSGYLEHWSQFDAAGWSNHWAWGGVSATNWHYRDITVPAGARRLVVVLTLTSRRRAPARARRSPTTWTCTSITWRTATSRSRGGAETGARSPASTMSSTSSSTIRRRACIG